MSNKDIVVSNNEQFTYAIQKANDKKENYIISYNDADIDSSFPNIKSLYQNESRKWLPNNANISLDDYKDNILRYNNYNKNLIQDTTYVKYDNTINDNSLIIDNSYNSLYYVQPEKVNLLSYSLNVKNGFNYNENNHTLYFDVDNKYIKSINNLLYYNYNNIRNTSPDNIGVASTDDNYFDVKNNNNSYSNNTLTIIKEFKTEIFSTLNKIKNLYKECEVIYDTLTYFNKVNNNWAPLSLDGGRDPEKRISYGSREIKFENPKLYYTNYEMGVDSLDLSNVDTLYVFDLNNTEFNIGYNNVKNYDYLSNKVIYNTANNVNTYNMNLLKNKMSLTLAENEATADISYNHYYTNINGDKYPIGTTYNINLNNTDETIFDNGISILYKSSPYINIDQNVQTITLPYKKELNIRKIAGSFKRYFYTTQIAKDEANNVEYLFVSSHYETKPFYVPKNSFDYLKSNNTITDCFNLQYFSSRKPGNKYDDVDPVLNIYPNNYINDKYFDSDLILYLNIEDDTNDIIRYTQISDNDQIITNEDELSTCISKVRDIYLNSVKCLYFYKLRYNDAGEYFETIGDPNMLIFEEDIDSMLTFIARNNVKFIFTTSNETIARNLEYSLDGSTWNKFDNTQEDNEYYITEDSGVYTCVTGRIENSNKILWKLELDSLLQDENSGVLDYLNSGNGIGRFSSIYDGTNTNPEKNKPKFEIFGNSMSLVYGENIKETTKDKNGEDVVEYKTELVNKPNIFRGLFTESQIISARRLALPALTLAQSNCCYAEMFKNCKALADYPTLPATILSDKCYKGMFEGCEQLRSAPRLDAKIMRAECYKEMFKNCITLSTPPNVTKKYPTGILPSTELNYACYESMFEGCRDMYVMPQLVASIMKEKCYRQMFKGCENISRATNMPAIQEFAKSCFYFMFYGTKIVPHVITSGTKINICQNLYFNAEDGTKEHEKFVHNVQIGALQGLFGGTDINATHLEAFLPEMKINGVPYRYLNTFLNGSYNNLENECYLDMFKDSKINIAPVLPATEMKKGCYKQMFQGCTSLYCIPQLYILTTDEECCYRMFHEAGNNISSNSSITTLQIADRDGSRLSDNNDTLAKNCYYEMFRDCNKLSNTPLYIGGSISKDESCYQMFYNCTSMTTPPQSININTMSFRSCYKMFYNCVNARHIPEMQVSTTSFECCYQMFYLAGSATNNVDINMNGNSRLSSNDDTLKENCYYQMFYGSKIKEGPTYIGGNVAEKTSCYQMFMNCKSMTTPPESINIKTMNEQSCYRMFYDCSNVHHIPEMHIDTTATECCYQMFWHAGTDTNGVDIYMKGDSRLSSNTDTLAKNCYYQMFSESKIKEGPTYIGGNESFETTCYMMFYDCRSLTTPPESINIKAMNVKTCYRMFYNCIKLESIPKMNVNSSAEQCCEEMFLNGGKDYSGYITLSNITLVTGNNALANKAFKKMFSGCTQIKNMSSVIIGSGNSSASLECCMDMFSGCTSLIDMPILNSRVMAEKCYMNMFKECSSLQMISNTLLPSTTLATSCYESMFEGCTSLVDVSNDTIENPLLGTTTLRNRCYANMFKGCISLIDAPTLPAERLVSQCYDHMFDGCSSLRSITALFLDAPMNELDASPIKTDEAVANSTDQWVNGVYTYDENNNDRLDAWEDYTDNYSEYTGNEIEFSNLTNHEGDVVPNKVFIRNHAATWDVRNNIGVDGIPKNWKIYDDNDSDYNNRLSPVFIFFYSDSNRNFEDYSKLIYGFNGDDCTSYIPKYDPNYISSVYYDSSTNKITSHPDDFCRRGYIFEGWKNDVNDTDPAGDISYINGKYSSISFTGQDQHYWAKWTPTEYPIEWYYFNTNNAQDLYATTYGDYDSLISSHKPDAMTDIDDPVPTHHYPYKDGYIFVGWNSQENQRTENLYRNVVNIDKNGNITTTSSNLVGYVGTENGQQVNENKFYAVWKYIVKWNVNVGNDEGYYTENNDNQITAYYYYQNNYLYNDNLIFPNSDQEPSYNSKYRFGGWATYQGPVGNDPYIPDMYTDIQDIYTSIKSGTDAIPTNPNTYKVTEPKNYYATWRYEIIWYGYTNNTTTIINYGYYNDWAKNYRPSTDPTMTRRIFVGWNSDENQREDNLDTIIIHNSGSADNTIYPVWKYEILWHTRTGDTSSHGYYTSLQIDNVEYFESYFRAEYLYGDSLTPPSEHPTRDDEDYEFAGWADYSGPSGSTIWEPNISDDCTVSEYDDFYAVYKPAITWYTFSGVSYGKTYGYYNDNALSYKPNNPSINRYTFIGWNDIAPAANPITSITITNPASNNIYAVWEYSVQWNTYGGSYTVTGDDAITDDGYYENYYYKDGYRYGDTLGEYGNDTHYPQYSPSREHYEFGGWATYKGPSGNNVWQANISNDYAVTNIVDFYAVWKSAIFWYNYNGTSLIATTFGNYNASVSSYKPANQTRTGYTFNGWNTSTNQTSDNITDVKVKDYYDDNTTNVFYEAYSINSYTITFKYGDYTPTEGSVTTKTVVYGSAIGDLPTGKREGYANATQWKYPDDYLEGRNVSSTDTMPADNITLTIVASNANSYTITFNYDTENTGYSGTETSRTVTYGQLIVGENGLPTATKSGYADSTTWKYPDDYLEGRNVSSEDTMPARDLELTIVEGSQTTFTITFNYDTENTGYSGTETSRTVTVGQLIVGENGLPTGTKTGYADSSTWKYPDDYLEGRNVSSEDIMPARDLELTIVAGDQTTFTITFDYGDYSGSISSKTVTAGQEIGELPTGTRTGYADSSTWKYPDDYLEGRNVSSEDTMPARDLELTIVATNKVPYSITFTCSNQFTINNSTTITITNCYYGDTLATCLSNSGGSFPIAVRTGYNDIDSWRYNDYTTGDFAQLTDTMPNDNLTLYMDEESIEKITCTITFSLEGSDYDEIIYDTSGSGGNDEEQFIGDMKYVKYGDPLGTLPIARDSEHVYDDTQRWMIEGTNTEVTSLTQVTESMTLVPWQNVKPFVIVYYCEHDVDGGTVKFKGYTQNDMQYSTDSTTWQYLPATNYDTTNNILTFSYGNISENDTVTINDITYHKKIVYFRAKYVKNRNINFYTSTNDINKEWFEIEGNVMALNCTDTNFDNVDNQSSLDQLFRGDPTDDYAKHYLKNANNLIMPDYDISCYAMFRACNKLVNGPTLRATSLVDGTYQNMFYNCTSLENVESVQVTILSRDNCYNSMFSGCKSLTTIPRNLFPTQITAAPKYMCNDMFSWCTSLRSIPDNLLPATILGDFCYTGMFHGCTSLTTIPDNLLPATTLGDSCYAGMFGDCTSLTSSITLPAETLIEGCYYDMFENCNNIPSITILARNIYPTVESARSYIKKWLQGINSNGILYVPNEAPNGMKTTWDTLQGLSSTGYIFVPGNWNIVGI